jgi:hypothetical protein
MTLLYFLVPLNMITKFDVELLNKSAGTNIEITADL